MNLSKIKWSDAIEFAGIYFDEDLKQNLTTEEQLTFLRPMTITERMRIHDLLQSIQLNKRSVGLLSKEGQTAETIMKELKPYLSRKHLTGPNLRRRVAFGDKAKRVKIASFKK